MTSVQIRHRNTRFGGVSALQQLKLQCSASRSKAKRSERTDTRMAILNGHIEPSEATRDTSV
jgi:hypothetical protein